MIKVTKMKYLAIILFIYCVGYVECEKIDVPYCKPPDYPAGGGYGPPQELYMTGDIIHYFCDSLSHIGGNFYRRCEDNGDWIGDTPVCDYPALMSRINQSSTVDPVHENAAFFASDEDRQTCSSTAAGHGEYWMGFFRNPGELIRIMLFMPRGEVAYDVILMKSNGEELSCGQRKDLNTRLEWSFHNCPGPNNQDAIGVKIKSLSSKPLQICEVVAHVLTSPTCVDPHLHIFDGRIELSRHTAELVCDAGFIRGKDYQAECIRDGVWNSYIKRLECREIRLEEPNMFDNEV